MIPQILVPLDGSELAETILPIVAYFSTKMDSFVRLIHVIEKHAKAQIHEDQSHLTSTPEAIRYLEKIKVRLGLPNDRVTIHVHSESVEDVAQSIISHADRELKSDLVIMNTHGRGGTRRFFFGSIAQQVVSNGHTPVLFVKPEYQVPESGFDCRVILVPLDASPDHESGFDIALTIAIACVSRLCLLSVIPTTATAPGKWTQVQRLLPGASSEMLDIEMENVVEYVARKKALAIHKGVEVEGFVDRGEIVKTASEMAKSKAVDLIVMGSHGRAGFDAFWEGSVAAGICGQAIGPVLLVPEKNK